MRIAVGLPQVGEDVAAAVRAARDAEDAGAWGVWVFDNLAPIVRPERPALEGWTLLALLARATSRVRIVSLVTRAGLRYPALVARMAAVVQDASGGRLILGLGAGDAASRREEERFGIVRAEQDRERAIRATVAAVRGDAMVRPVVELPPLWIGGTAPRIVRLAAELADAWHGWGLEPDGFAARRPSVESWWGGMFHPDTARERLAALEDAGASGVTWMLPSARDAGWRPALLELVRQGSG